MRPILALALVLSLLFACAPEDVCANGEDDDGDLLIDVADEDCGEDLPDEQVCGNMARQGQCDDTYPCAGVEDFWVTCAEELTVECPCEGLAIGFSEED